MGFLTIVFMPRQQAAALGLRRRRNAKRGTVFDSLADGGCGCLILSWFRYVHVFLP